MLTLKIYKRHQLRQTVRLERRNYIIGRALTSDIVIPDNRVSRKHCSILYDPEAAHFLLFDLNSKQGTYLNGDRVEEELVLEPRASISLGSSDFTLQVVAPDESQPLLPDKKITKESVTSEVELQRVQSYADPRLLRRRLTPPELREDSDEAAVAMSFYDLSVRMSLAVYPQQEYQILASHLFDSTPADRMLLIRLHPARDRTPDERETDMSGRASRYEYTMGFSAFDPETAESIRDVGEEFSRTMCRRSIESNQAILFSYQGNNQSDSMTRLQAHSSICAPLLGHDEVLGIFYLDVFDINKPAFNHLHLKLVSMAAYLFALFLERERAIEDVRETERLSSAGMAVFGAAHHLKNILTALQGSRQVIEKMLDYQDYDAIEETWQVMTRSIDKITGTIREMLNFARDEKLKFEPEDAEAILADVVNQLRETAAESGVQLEFDRPRRSVHVTCDRERIEQVLQNLVVNAIESFDEVVPDTDRQPYVRVRAEYETKGVVFEIADNGPGIPEKMQRRLFDLFSSTKGQRGTGLGLALSRKYVRQHGGDITYRTSPQGTTFWVSIPMHEDEEQDAGTNP